MSFLFPELKKNNCHNLRLGYVLVLDQTIWHSFLFSFFGHMPKLAGIPELGLNPWPLQWKPGVLTTGLLGKSQVQFSHSVMFNSLRPHGLQHARLPCPSPATRASSNSCPSSWWCHPTISSSVVPFSSCLQSFPLSGSFLWTLSLIIQMPW